MIREASAKKSARGKMNPAAKRLDQGTTRRKRHQKKTRSRAKDKTEGQRGRKNAGAGVTNSHIVA